MGIKQWSRTEPWKVTDFNEALKQIDEDFAERGINVKWRGAKGDGITDDTDALEEAINWLYQRGGGKLFLPSGTYLISRPLVLTDRNVIIEGSGHSTIIKAKVEMNRMIDYNGNHKFGHRGGGIMNLKVHGNNLAEYGVVIGHQQGTVVGEYFHHIRIEYVKKWGMVWDACQNNYFNLIDIEYCGGGLLMLNGAGNNKVDKSEFSTMTTTYHVMGATDPSFPGYGNNDFLNIPQANKFYSCVFERGTGLSAIYLETGRHNQFNDCEFSTATLSEGAVYVDSAATLTHLTRCRFAGGFTVKPAVSNHGHNTYVTDCYFENYTNEEIIVSNRTIIGDGGANNSVRIPRVKNIGGDSAVNIVVTAAPRFFNNGITPESPKVSEFFHNDQNQVFFQGKSKLQQFIMGKSVNVKKETVLGTQHSVVIPLTKEGSWLVDVIVGNGDYNHTRSATFIVRYKERGNPTFNLANVQKIGNDVISGSSISLLNMSVDTSGNLTVAAQTTSNSITIIQLNAICQIEYI